MEENTKNKDPEFINEVVKEKKKSKKSLLKKVAFVLILAAGAGAVAGVVFTLIFTNLNSTLGTGNGSSSKISISDNSSDETSEASSSSSVSSSSSSETSAISDDGEPIVNEITYDMDLSVEDYEKLYEDLYEIAHEAQNCLVSVTGIISQIDYFNESYQNEQTSMGLVVAEDDAQYYILTFSNILENAESIQVTFSGHNSCEGARVRSDSDTGFSMISVRKDDLPEEIPANVSMAPLGSSAVVRGGDLIIVIGNPDGYTDYIGYGSVTSTSNIISCYDREYTALTTSISNGSGGLGIVLDLSGNVIGITSAASNSVSTTTMTAMAVSDIKDLINTLLNNESRAYVGVKGYDVTNRISEQTGIPVGVMVESIGDNSPAMFSGMMEYDIIISLGGEEIQTVSDLSRLLAEHEPGETVALSVMRQVADTYSQVDLNVTLGEI